MLGVQKNQKKGDSGIGNVNISYFKFRDTNPDTQELDPCFVPNIKKPSGAYEMDWTETVSQINGIVLGVEARNYEFKTRGKTSIGFELRLWLKFDNANYCRIDFGKSNMVYSLLNALSGNLVGKPMSFFVYDKDNTYSNISIKHYKDDGSKRTSWDRVEMPISFKDFYKKYTEDSPTVLKFVEDSIIPHQNGWTPKELFNSDISVSDIPKGDAPAPEGQDSSVEGFGDLPF